MADKTDYTDLITSEHDDKPNFVATVGAAIAAFVDEQNLLTGYPDDFDLDEAFGVMLDVCGQWIGISRVLRAPLTNVYFSFGTIGLGFGSGVWKDPSQPTYGLVTLDDGTYRSLLKAKALSNGWDGTLGTAQAILAEWFSTFPGTYPFVQDNMDMTITIGIAGINPSPLFQFMTAQGYIAIRPGGVRLRETLMSSVSGTPLFGFGVNNQYIAGFGVGSWGTVLPTA